MIYTTKKELAQAYCPDIDYTAALKKLNHWIRTNTELSARLAATGYITTQRRFTPQQVKLLYHYLGRSEERRVGKECRSRWSPYH